MADIALLSSTSTSLAYPTIDNVQLTLVDITEQLPSAIAGVALGAGDAVYFDSNGLLQKSSAANAGTAKVDGIVWQKVAAGQAVTPITIGVVAGYDLPAIGTTIFLSDTAGKLADAAGTVSVKVGRVQPFGPRKNAATAHGRVLRFNLTA